MDARSSAFLVAMAIALGGAGCGGSDDETASADKPPTPEAQVKAVYAKFIKSAYARDPAAACRTMTRPVQRELAADEKSCERWATQSFKYLPLLKQRPRVRKVVQDGKELRASITSGVGSDVLLWFGREDGAWKISAGLRGRHAARESAAER